MTDLQKLAEREGWKLVTVIDNGTTHPYLDIAGVSMSDRAAKEHVLTRAKNLSKPHTEAIRLVMTSRVPTTTRKKR